MASSFLNNLADQQRKKRDNNAQAKVPVVQSSNSSQKKSQKRGSNFLNDLASDQIAGRAQRAEERLNSNETLFSLAQRKVAEDRTRRMQAALQMETANRAQQITSPNPLQTRPVPKVTFNEPGVQNAYENYRGEALKYLLDNVKKQNQENKIIRDVQDKAKDDWRAKLNVYNATHEPEQISNTKPLTIGEKIKNVQEGISYGIPRGLGYLSAVEAVDELYARAKAGKNATPLQLENAHSPSLREALKRERIASEAAPNAYAVGNAAGSIGLLVGTGEIAGAALPAAVPEALVPGITHGATTALQEAGNLATGRTTPSHYAGDIIASAGGGILGGQAAQYVAGHLGKAVTQNPNLRNNKFLRLGVASAVGAAHSFGRTGAKIASGKNVTFAQAMQDAAIDAIFGSVNFILRGGMSKAFNEGTTPGEARIEEKWFKDVSDEDLAKAHRRLYKQYAPDQINRANFASEAEYQAAWQEANDTYAQISREFAWRKAQQAAGSYNTAAQAKASGDTKAYATANEAFRRNGTELITLLKDNPDATEAIEALSAIVEAGVDADVPSVSYNAHDNTTDTTPDMGLPAAQPPVNDQLMDLAMQAQGANDGFVNEGFDAAGIEDAPSVEEVNDELGSPFAVYDAETHPGIYLDEETARAAEQYEAEGYPEEAAEIAQQREEAVEELSQNYGKTGQEAYGNMVDKGPASLIEFQEGFSKLYNAARSLDEGAVAAARQDSAVAKLTAVQQDVAVSAGLEDARIAAKENTYGREGREGLQRARSNGDLSQRSGESTGSISGRAKTLGELWGAGGEAADDQSADLQIKSERAAEEILRTARPGQKVYIVEGETEHLQNARAIDEIGGTHTTYYASKTGDIDALDHGDYVQVRGSIDHKTGEITVCVNNKYANAYQIRRHEEVEAAIIDGRIDPKAFIAKAKERLSENLSQAFDTIASAYGLDPDQAQKEFLCDIGGEINQFRDFVEEGHTEYEDLAYCVDALIEELHPELDALLDGKLTVHRSRQPRTVEYSGNLSGKVSSNNVSESRKNGYSKAFLEAKPDVEVTVVSDSPISGRDNIINNAFDNLAEVGTKNDSGVYGVFVPELGNNVIVSKNAIKHGLDRRTGLQGVVISKIGSVLKNAVLINEVTPRNQDASDHFILAGIGQNSFGRYPTIFHVNRFTNEVEEMDILYSSNTKKEPAAFTARNQGSNPPIRTGSTIKVSELLELVNETHPQYLSEDVLRAFGHDRRPEAKDSGDILYSSSVQRQDKTLHDNGIVVDRDAGVAHYDYSTKVSWKTPQQVDKAVKALMKANEVDEETARRYVESEMSLTNLILWPENVAAMDFTADDRYTAIKKNSDYPQGTVDFNNNCRKRVPFTTLYDRLQQRNPDRVFTAEDLEIIRQEMIEHGYPVACAFCYVEERRQHIGEIADDFVQLYTNGGLLKRFEGKKPYDKLAEALDRAKSDDYKPRVADLTTYEGLRKLAENHKGIADAFQIFNNARGMQSGRLVEGRAEYKREILSYTPAQVKRINDLGGLRIFSYSDFEAINLLDLVQVIQDASAVGLKIQAYTKVPAFARVVRNTGIKLNRSLISKGTGIKYVNGKAELDLDTVEGIDVNDPDFFDSTDDRDIGNIIIGMSDDQIHLAMESPLVDYIIPFHTSLPREILEKKNIAHWKNYKLFQNDKDIATGKNAAKNINIYTDVIDRARDEGHPITNRQEFQEMFFQVAKERNLIPRFAQFLKKDVHGNYLYTPGYEKFLIDFKLFDKNGNIIEQLPVRPEFDDAFNTKLMNDFANGVGYTAISEELYKDTVKALNEKSKGEKISYSTKLKKQKKITENAITTLKKEGYTPREVAAAVESGSDYSYSTRLTPAPKKTITAYKAFYAHDGKLYPPMVSNDDTEVHNKGVKKVSGTLKGLETPVGVWIDADVGALALGEDGKPLRNTKGRLAVKNDKGGGTLAFRPGWHLGLWPDAKQFNVKDPITGELKACMPDGLVFARCSVAADNDYQLEALGYGMKKNGKFDRTQAGLPRIPKDGYYMYRTNVDPTTAPWIITGAIKVEEILDDDMAAEICAKYGITADPRASHKKINLADYGLKAGPVTPTEDMDRFLPNDAVKANAAALEAALADPDYADAYVASPVNFDDPEIIKELERNKQNAAWYKAAQAKYGNKSYPVSNPNDPLLDQNTFAYSSKLSLPTSDTAGRKLSKAQQKFFENSAVRDDEGKLKVVFHGTSRMDRVGTVFRADRATSGPMSFFTDNRTIAENYSTGKQDTSIAYDERYQDYYTQFRVTRRGKDMSVSDLWSRLTQKEKNKILAAAPHITMDDDWENIVYDPNSTRGLGNWDQYLLRKNGGNALKALTESWLEDGNLYGSEEQFLDVLKMVGIDDAEYYDPEATHEGVYEVYLNITRPFDAVNEVTEDFVRGYEEWYAGQDQEKYDRLSANADMWDKNNQTASSFAERMRDDIANSRSNAWTSIPDSMTDYLKSLGYDGIMDQGGKGGGEGHTVYIPFYPNQIKNTTNDNPTSENEDIRYSSKLNLRNLTPEEKERFAQYRKLLADRRRERKEISEARKKLLKKANKAVRLAKNRPGYASEAIQDLLKDLDLVAVGIRSDTKDKLTQKYFEILEMREQDPNYAALHSEKDMRKVERLFKKQIKDMDIDEVRDLITELTALTHYQETQNKLFRDSQNRDAAEAGRQWVKELKEIKSLDITKGAKQLGAKYLRNNLSPERAARMISGYKKGSVAEELVRHLEDGLTAQLSFEQKADALFRPFLEDKANADFVKNASKQTIQIADADGVTAMISPAMRVALYMHRQNDDNLTHIASGGIVVPNPKLYEQGKIKDAYNRGRKLRLNPTDIDAIIADMTPSERAYADLLHEFFEAMAKDAINDTSLTLDGIFKAVVEGYFPISTDANFLAKAMDLVNDPTLEGWGNLKARQEGSVNPILLEDATKVLQRHIKKTGQYYGLAVPLRDFQKVYGYVSSGYESSVQKAIGEVWDEETKNYLTQWITDLNTGGRQAERGILEWMRSAYAGSVLTFNPSVALKQTTSYFMAGSILDTGSLMYGLSHKFTKADREYMDSITPWGWARRQGQSTIELGDMAKRRDFASRLPNWNQAMDVFTTDQLFMAAENAVRKEHPGLKRGDKAYDEALAEKYNQVLWRTQPQYDAMFRPEYLRKTDIGSRTFGMFKTESMQMSGELIDAFSQWKADSRRAKDGTDETRRAKSDSAKNFYKTFASWVASNMAFAVMGTALNIVLLHKAKNYRDEKGEIDLKTLAEKTALNFLGSSMGGFFYGSTVYDIGQYIYNAVKGQKPTWYDIEAPGLSLINDAINDMGNLIGVFTGGDANREAVTKAIAKFALSASKFTHGGFAENIYNMLNSIYLYMQDIRNGVLGSYEAGENLFGLKDTAPTKDQYAKQALDAYSKGNEKKGDRALDKTGKTQLEKALGAEAKKDENGETISGSKQQDAIRKINELDMADEYKVKLIETMYPKVEISDAVALEDVSLDEVISLQDAKVEGGQAGASKWLIEADLSEESKQILWETALGYSPKTYEKNVGKYTGAPTRSGPIVQAGDIETPNWDTEEYWTGGTPGWRPHSHERYFPQPGVHEVKKGESLDIGKPIGTWSGQQLAALISATNAKTPKERNDIVIDYINENVPKNGMTLSEIFRMQDEHFPSIVVKAAFDRLPLSERFGYIMENWPMWVTEKYRDQYESQFESGTMEIPPEKELMQFINARWAALEPYY